MTKCTLTPLGRYIETRWCPTMQAMLVAKPRKFHMVTTRSKVTGHFSENLAFRWGGGRFVCLHFCPFCGAEVWIDDTRARIEVS